MRSMDFAMRYGPWYRIWATIAGFGRSRTMIRVADDQLRVKHGWAFHIDIPLANIHSAKPTSERPLAWGVHCTGDAWWVNASRDGIVEIKLDQPVSSPSVRFQSSSWGEVRSLYIGVEDPDGLFAALTRNR
jgi:hypothetical protein